MESQFQIYIYTHIHSSMQIVSSWVFDGITVCDAEREEKNAPAKMIYFCMQKETCEPIENKQKMANDLLLLMICLLKTATECSRLECIVVSHTNCVCLQKMAIQWFHERLSIFAEAHSTHQSIGCNNLWKERRRRKGKKTTDARIQNSKQTLEFGECSETAQNLVESTLCVCVCLTILHILRKRRNGCI